MPVIRHETARGIHEVCVDMVGGVYVLHCRPSALAAVFSKLQGTESEGVISNFSSVDWYEVEFLNKNWRD